MLRFYIARGFAEAREQAWGTAVPGCGDRQRGFTLIEMMITVAVIAIVASLAVPWMGQVVRSNQMTSQGNSLLGALQYARAESQARGERVLMCGSSDGSGCDGRWGTGWIVVVDDGANSGQVDASDTVLRTYTAATAIDSESLGHIGFTHEGRRTPGSLSEVIIKRSDCANEGSRTLSVSSAGRISLASGEC